MAEFVNVTVRIPKEYVREILTASILKRGLYQGPLRITKVPINVLVKCQRVEWAAELEKETKRARQRRMVTGDVVEADVVVVDDLDNDADTGRAGKRRAPSGG